MISKAGSFWSTGITIRFLAQSITRGGRRYDGWSATAKFYDGGFCNDDTDTGLISTQGELGTRYFVRDGETVDGLTAAIDVVLANAEKVGIKWGQGTEPTLYYEGDGEDPEWPPPPDWERILHDQCIRLGWKPLYSDGSVIDGEIVPDRAQIGGGSRIPALKNQLREDLGRVVDEYAATHDLTRFGAAQQLSRETGVDVADYLELRTEG